MTDQEENMMLLRHSIQSAGNIIADLKNRPMDYECRMAVSLSLLETVIHDCSMYFPDQGTQRDFERLREVLRFALEV